MCLYLHKDLEAGHWSFLGPGSETKWYSTYNERQQGEWDRVTGLVNDQFRRKRRPSFPSHESIVSRNAQKQRRWKNYLYTSCADGDTIETVFRTMVRPVLAEQSDPLFAPANLLIMTPRLLIEIPAQENFLQKYKERVEKLPQLDRLLKKNCTDEGFLKTVEVGQYFMTKYTELVPCWEVTTSYLQGKYGVEIRIESVNKDNSHSWVRISHVLNKLVTDLIDKEYDDNEQKHL